MIRKDAILLVVWAVILAVMFTPHEPETARRGSGYTASWKETDKQLACLAANVYMEARGESIQGQIAVAQVVMNRAKQDRNRVCKVVMAPAQFSWTLDRKPLQLRNESAFKTAVWVAKNVLNGNLHDRSHGADHYHADYVAPKWATSDCMTKTTTIGRHIFFKCHYGRYKTL